MATFTKNHGLIKPGLEDYYDIADFNDNMDAIDTIFAEAEAEQQKISDKIGKPTDMGASTIFGKLNNGNSVIKSIQKVTYTPPASTGSGSVNIKTVNPNKCLVIMERLYEKNDTLTKISYRLNANNISLEHDSYVSPNAFIVGFWVIEFN